MDKIGGTKADCKAWIKRNVLSTHMGYWKRIENGLEYSTTIGQYYTFKREESLEAKIYRLLKNVRIYDNGGKTLDRYTAVYMNEPDHAPGTFNARGMSKHPFSPQGFGCSCTAVPGRHLGRRIKFEDCPPDVQKCILQDLGIKELKNV